MAASGPVDVLVNNAEHCETPDDLESLTAESLERHYRVNAIAPALLIAEVARRYVSGPPPAVVNVSTDAARAFPGQLGYSTSKAALEALTRATALDLGPRGIRVNAVAPGPVQTRLAPGALDHRAGRPGGGRARAVTPGGLARVPKSARKSRAEKTA
nr:SDR family oxidoreductase [Streptomyces roseirectus]